MTTNIEAELKKMSKKELVKLCAKLGIDGTFKIINRDMAKLFHSQIEAGKTLVFIDLANMHGANHKYGMNTVDTFINNVLQEYRQRDLWIRWGSDEIVCVMEDGDVVDFIGRLGLDLICNNLYAVFAYVTTSESLVESINRADTICMAMKNQLEKHGLKASRDEEYTVMACQVVTE